MPFDIPTLEALVGRSAGAFRANLKGSDAKLWPNNVAVSSKVIGGSVWEAFSFLEYISRQHVKHLAEGQWLERHAFDYGLARLPASQAEGTAIVSGDAGVPVPSGLVLERADGIVYDSTSSGVTDGGGHATVSIRAREAGRSGNAISGVALSLAAPVSRIRPSGHVVGTGGAGGGAEVESDESLRSRLLFRLRNPPHGGAAHDYVIWAREVPGVTRVFVDPVSSSNARASVGIWFLMDDAYANGIPQAADVSLLRAHLDTLRPAGALLDIAAPTAYPVNLNIANVNPDTTAVRDAIRAELADLFRTRMKVATFTDRFSVRVSKIWEAISIATGEESHVLVAPSADIVVPVGSIPTMGTITFSLLAY